MTSLELLQHIKKAPEFNGGDSRYKTASNSSILYNEDIDKIEKELKVLEIITKDFNIDTDYFGTDEHTEYIVLVSGEYVYVSKEEYKLFNEVLKGNE